MTENNERRLILAVILQAMRDFRAAHGAVHLTSVHQFRAGMQAPPRVRSLIQFFAPRGDCETLIRVAHFNVGIRQVHARLAQDKPLPELK